MRIKFKLLLILLVFPIALIAQSSPADSSSVAKGKKVRKIIIPTIKYNNSFKAIFGFIATGLYALNRSDSISPPSSSTLMGNYSTNDTWFGVQANKFYFKEDTYRSRAAIGLGSINFQTYAEFGDLIEGIPPGILPLPLPEEGGFIDYNTKFQFVFIDFKARVYKKLYLGINLIYSHSTTDFDAALIPDEEVNLFGFGVATEYDTRDNQFMPGTGFNGRFNTMTFLEGLGSSSDYSNINLEYNHYFPQGDRNTILLRFFGQAAMGQVPFSGKNVVGRDDLRGYSNGKYRANQVYDIQSEYRHWFAKRWGYVAFGGVATAINDASDFSFDNLLPAVGGGIRFLAIPSSRISVGMDLAVGKDDWGVYFRIGEAFTR